MCDSRSILHARIDMHHEYFVQKRKSSPQIFNASIFKIDIKVWFETQGSYTFELIRIYEYLKVKLFFHKFSTFPAFHHCNFTYFSKIYIANSIIYIYIKQRFVEK